MREWDCGHFNDGERFWCRVTVREIPGGYQVAVVRYDRFAGMGKSLEITGMFRDLERLADD